MNATATRRPKQPRTCNVTVEGEWFLLTINHAKGADFYLATQDTAADCGLVYRLEKQAPNSDKPTAVYNVNLGDTKDTFPSCDCPGHCFHQTECKHLAALSALYKANKLPVVKPVVPSLACLIDLDNTVAPPPAPKLASRNCGCRSAEEHYACCLSYQEDDKYRWGEEAYADCPAPGRDDY